MDKNKFQTSIFISAFIVILLSTGFITYAYFTARATGINVNLLNVSSASIGQAYTTMGTIMRLDITGEDTLRENASDESPSVVVGNSTPIDVSVETADQDGTLTCYYDIVFVAHEPYYNSEQNPGNAKELVMWSNETNYNEEFFEEVMINNISGELIIRESIKISATGIREKVVHNWDIKVGFYNQTFDQTDKVKQKFSGDIDIQNLRCDNFVHK